MKKIIYFVLLLSLISSCNKRSKQQNKSEYDVDIKLPDKLTFSFSEYFDSIEVVPLELTKNSALKKCDKILIFNNNYFVFDRKNTGIYVFDMNGKFLYNSISKYGDGPENYGCITDFNIDSKTGDIYILDASSLKLKVFDVNFKYKDYVKLPSEILPLSCFQRISDDIFLFYDSSFKKKYCINVYSKNKNTIVKKIGYVNREEAKHLSTVNPYPFFSTKQETTFINRFPDNNLYHIEKTDLVSFIKYSIEGKEFNLDKLENDKEISYYKQILINEKKAFIVNLRECETYVSAFVYYSNSLFLNIFNKRENTSYTIPNKFDNGNAVLLPPEFIDENCIYITTFPDNVNKQIETKYLTLKSKSVVNNIKDDDNEIIIKYFIKQ